MRHVGQDFQVSGYSSMSKPSSDTLGISTQSAKCLLGPTPSCMRCHCASRFLIWSAGVLSQANGCCRTASCEYPRLQPLNSLSIHLIAWHLFTEHRSLAAWISLSFGWSCWLDVLHISSLFSCRSCISLAHAITLLQWWMTWLLL